MLVKFNPEHLNHLDLQPAQHGILPYLDSKEYVDLLMCGSSWTFIGDGKVVYCGGFYPLTDTIARGWALVGLNAGRYLYTITKLSRDFFNKSEYARIETVVKQDFEQGHRWMRLLGFQNETPDGMRNYGPDGSTYYLYATFPEVRHGRT